MAWNSDKTQLGATTSGSEWNTMVGVITTSANLIASGGTIYGPLTVTGSLAASSAAITGGTFSGLTSGAFSGTLDMNNNNITEIKQAIFNGVVDDGNSSTADTIDWSTGSFHKSTLTGNCTYTFTAPTGLSRLTLQVVQGAGPYTVTWPASVKWAGASAPTLGTTNGRSDFITFIYDGTNYWGVASTNFN